MSTAPNRTLSAPSLRHGDRLTQEEFHRRYEQYPSDVKFELIGGVVYMASPQKRAHGNCQGELGCAITIYKGSTPGTEVFTNSTTILGRSSEPQPDLALRILHDWGGKSRETHDDYVKGAPEFIAEIADTTKRLGLGGKKIDYQRAGVVEYLVWCVEDREIHWFDLEAKSKITSNRSGILCSRVFPGLWLDEQALLDGDTLRLLRTVQRGLASRAHAAFVKRLQAEHRRLASR